MGISYQVTALYMNGSLLCEVHEQHEEPGVATLVLTGELDRNSEDLLTAALARTWNTWPVAVTIDLQAVEFLGARGLSCLVRTAQTARARRVTLTLLARPGLVTRLLTLVDLDAHLAPARRPVLTAIPGSGSQQAPHPLVLAS